MRGVAFMTTTLGIKMPSLEIILITEILSLQPDLVAMVNLNN